MRDGQFEQNPQQRQAPETIINPRANGESNPTSKNGVWFRQSTGKWRNGQISSATFLPLMGNGVIERRSEEQQDHTAP